MGRIVCPRPGGWWLSSGNRDVGRWLWGREFALTGTHLRPVFALQLRKGTKPPSPYATLAVGDTSHKTKVLYWEMLQD